MDGIATITATLEGETVEDNSVVNRGSLTSLLASLFDNDDVSITIHDIHNTDQIEDIKARYEQRYNARVTEAI